MDNLTFEKIKEAIEKYNNIAVVVPANPSMDKMAAALSLYFVLSDLGKNASVASPQEPLVEVSSLVGIDRVKTSLGGEGGDLIVSFPYKEGEIEKVSYTREDNFLNIVVKAGELGLGFNEQDIRFTRGGATPELLFTVGAERISDLGKLFDPTNLKDTVVVNIDNGRENQGFGDILMVSTRFSSVSEAIANLIISLNFKMDPDIAQNLLLGIENATRNFQDPNTSSLAFEMVGTLIRNGAVRSLPQMPRGTDAFINSQEQKVKMEAPRIEEVERREPVRTQPAPRRVQSRVQQPEPQAEPQVQNDNPPEDWLEPKIYKGSTNF